MCKLGYVKTTSEALGVAKNYYEYSNYEFRAQSDEVHDMAALIRANIIDVYHIMFPDLGRFSVVYYKERSTMVQYVLHKVLGETLAQRFFSGSVNDKIQSLNLVNPTMTDQEEYDCIVAEQESLYAVSDFVETGGMLSTMITEYREMYLEKAKEQRDSMFYAYHEYIKNLDRRFMHRNIIKRGLVLN